MNATIQTECPACNQSLSLEARLAGQSVRCPVCNEIFDAVRFRTVTASDNKRLSSALSLDSLGDSAESQSRETLDGTGSSGTATLSGQTGFRKLGRFELKRLLGQGGFGKVYLAVDPELEREVALKVLVFGAGQRTRVQRFLTEAKAAARLKHPNIVPTFVSGQADGKYYIASEFIEGELLSKQMRRQQFSPVQAARTILKLANALAYAHENDVVHRDVKPHNIMIDQRGEPHLMDFGLAKRVDDDSTATSDGSVLGTPAYMSPEQARGEVSSVGPASDQYSLAVVLYQLLIGSTPFQGPPHLVIAEVAKGNVPPMLTVRSDLPRDLTAVCDQALQGIPDKRYATCREFASDLQNWLERRPVKARPLTAVQRLSRSLAEHRVMAGFTAVICTLLLLTMITLGVIWRRGKERGNTYLASVPPATSAETTGSASVSADESTQTNPMQGEEKTPASSAKVSATSEGSTNEPTSATGVSAEPSTEARVSNLRETGTFGFPQKDSVILCEHERLRLSLSSNSEYLFVQAVLWQDGDNALGKTNDGRDIGDTSNLSLDLDSDGSNTANVDRRYSLNPWPTLPGLYYQIQLGGGATTTLRDDSIGRGSIQYIEDSPGQKLRIDTFLLPLKELGIDANKEIRLSYWAGSPSPEFSFSAVGTSPVDTEYSHFTRHSDYYTVKLSNAPVTYDVAKIPEGRDSKPAASKSPSVASMSPGSVPPEIQAADWLNTNSPVSLESLKGQTVLVEFWATWCGPCIAGIPHLNEMQKKYGDKGFRILSLTAEDRETVEAFQKARKEPIEYTVGLNSESSDEYGVNGIPAAFLIGTDGKLLWNGHPSSAECEVAIAKALGVEFTPSEPDSEPDNERMIAGKPLANVGETMALAAKTAAHIEALRLKIEQAQKEVSARKLGHIIVGRVTGADDVELVNSQMMILPGGFFADATRDLTRPIGFRQLGYCPFDLVIPPDAVPDENGIIDVGTIVMEKADPSEIRRATGSVSLEGGGSCEGVRVSFSLSNGPVNTPSNGTEPRPRWSEPKLATVDSNGVIVTDGLTEGEYWVTYSLPGFVDASQGYLKVDPEEDLVLAPVELEKPRRVSVEFVVAKDSTTGFDASLVKKEEFPAGKRWKAGTEASQYGWDLEFKQIRRIVTLDYSYAPCTIADLGEGNLADFLQPPANAVQKDPRSVPVTSGHVYLLKQSHWKHDVLFRVDVGFPAEPKNSRVLAHLNFNDKSVVDLANNGATCDTQNSTFDGTAFQSTGLYEHGSEPNGQRFVVSTPKLNFKSFTVVMKFKPQSRDPLKSNILNGGTGYRWFGLSRTESGHLAIDLNNNTRLAELTEFPLPLNQWHDIVCAVDLDKGMIGVAVNNKPPRVIPLPAGFQLEVLSAKTAEREKQWTFSNYSNARTLLGLVDELTILDGVFSQAEFETLRQSLQH